MKMYGIIFILGNIRSKREIKRRFGRKNADAFYAKSKKLFTQITSRTPNIGKSVFAFNYAFAPAYIAWYKAAESLNFSADDIKHILWLINEKVITTIPSFMRKAYGKKYLEDFRCNAPIHEKRTAEGKVHDYDYIIKFKPQDDTSFGIDITRCGMRTLAADFDALGIFPTVCRVDYMIGAYLHSGFERTKTLGDGDECCNCRYIIGGKCQWNEKMSFEKIK